MNGLYRRGGSVHDKRHPTTSDDVHRVDRRRMAAISVKGEKRLSCKDEALYHSVTSIPKLELGKYPSEGDAPRKHLGRTKARKTQTRD